MRLAWGICVVFAFCFLLGQTIRHVLKEMQREQSLLVEPMPGWLRFEREHGHAPWIIVPEIAEGDLPCVWYDGNKYRERTECERRA